MLVPLSLAFFLMTAPAIAAEAPKAVEALSGEEIALQNGQTLRLSGIKAPNAEAKNILNDLVRDGTLLLEDAAPDRYGRISATASLDGQAETLQEILLRKGQAFFYPPAPLSRVEAYRAAEAQAFSSHQGVWSSPVFIPPQEAAKAIGTYAFIEGVVTSVDKVDKRIVLFFGSRDTPEFKAIFRLMAARSLKKEGLDLLSLSGKTVRLRGWITNAQGPSIEPTDIHQIEQQ